MFLFNQLTKIAGLIFSGGVGISAPATPAPIGGLQGAFQGISYSTPILPDLGTGSTGSSEVVNNFNPSFNPNINVGATFSTRDMAFIVKTGQRYLNNTSL